ncbi:hypothetical protein BATDEDRAFT_24565 [Batrachochytrium dendrobatidis JAM81]|uniref:Uncharacterized protein n=2 Tax=Batrachochytrium dendrobatidis TaxID=109871 RepID=F4P140_BATDJ|nr:uncharacterized protein BATDEDRAFT_24565 [Batrachochytrium dendrobatidis JAM81]EGF80984.1 hypothetical protein BATDEDRAFT_24565 [Batrachochytrium dendrobatidis JAM81]OAJ41782.1 hypothetical protein BDEG_25326 [Batrachochytrium dendrobatidis JEL423]|eukprot:XP_006678486.1 hypothetical protein BATDEDRAFT_24565 [Batrachochytrium dendrobatidis JAM81]
MKYLSQPVLATVVSNINMQSNSAVLSSSYGPCMTDISPAQYHIQDTHTTLFGILPSSWSVSTLDQGSSQHRSRLNDMLCTQSNASLVDMPGIEPDSQLLQYRQILLNDPSLAPEAALQVIMKNIPSPPPLPNSNSQRTSNRSTHLFSWIKRLGFKHAKISRHIKSVAKKALHEAGHKELSLLLSTLWKYAHDMSNWILAACKAIRAVPLESLDFQGITICDDIETAFVSWWMIFIRLKVKVESIVQRVGNDTSILDGEMTALKSNLVEFFGKYDNVHETLEERLLGYIQKPNHNIKILMEITADVEQIKSIVANLQEAVRNAMITEPQHEFDDRQKSRFVERLTSIKKLLDRKVATAT